MSMLSNLWMPAVIGLGAGVLYGAQQYHTTKLHPTKENIEPPPDYFGSAPEATQLFSVAASIKQYGLKYYERSLRATDQVLMIETVLKNPKRHCKSKDMPRAEEFAKEARISIHKLYKKVMQNNASQDLVKISEDTERSLRAFLDSRLKNIAILVQSRSTPDKRKKPKKKKKKDSL